MTRPAPQRQKATGGLVPTWPFVCIVVCLFVISVVAMRNWERPAAHHVSLEDSASKVLDAASQGTSAGQGSASRRGSASPDVRSSRTRVNPPAAPQATDQRTASNARQALLKGMDVAVSPRGAPPMTAPRVGEVSIAFPHDAASQNRMSDVPSFPDTLVDHPSGASSDPSRAGSNDDADGNLESDDQGDDEPAIDDNTQEGDFTTGTPATLQVSDGTNESTSPLPRRIHQTDSCWPFPETLVDQLEAAAESAHCHDWALTVLDELDRLAEVPTLESPEAGDVLDRLQKLAPDAGRLASTCLDDAVRVTLQRLEYALERRIAVWSKAQALAAANTVSLELASPDAQETRAALEEIESLLRQFPSSRGWRKYLLLSDLHRLAGGDAAQGGRSNPGDNPRATSGARATIDDNGLPTLDVSTEATTLIAERRETARRVLGRLESTSLTDEQEAFLDQPAFERLNRALRNWANEPINVPALLSALEQYEMSGATQAGRDAVQAVSILRWSPDETAVQLSRSVEQHYRNANLRIAVSEGLLNRLIPQPAVTLEDVEDYIAGADVYGVSENHTRLFLRLLPDRNRIRVGLEAKGVVASETEAYKGAATVYNDGLSQFHARKLVQVDGKGVRVWRSEARAESETQMTDLSTDYDNLPLFGHLARMIAMKQHDQVSSQARREVQDRVAERARQRLDEEVHRRVAKAEQQFQRQVMDPLRRLDLAPEVVDMQTTSQRIIVRSRLASDEQLAALTPRPLAPGISLISAQIHESVFNNLLDQLDLDGRRVLLDDLYHELSARAGHPDVEIPEDMPENITIEFAQHDAIHVRCDDGKLQLSIRVAELSQGRGGKWRNFEVRGYYYPETAGLDARLVRDGYVELVGERLGFRDQIALRGIFTKVLSKRTALRLVPDSIISDSRFRDLGINQFVIEDGWIGVAISEGNRSTQPHVASGTPPHISLGTPPRSASSMAGASSLNTVRR